MKLLKKLLLSFSACALFLSPISVMAYPEAENYANDFANVLDSEVENEINQKNNELEETNGAQIFVVTVDFLDGEEIDDYAYNLFNEWDIGSSSDNNGVLLLLAIGEENYYCLSGAGLEDVLDGGTLQVILDEYLEPDFAEGNYSDGVAKTFDALYEIVENTSGTPVYVGPEPQPEEEHSFFGGIFSMFGTIFALVIVIIIISAVFSGPRHGPFYRRPIIWIGGHHHHRPRPPRPPRGGGFGGGSFGGGFGGGAGRGGGFRGGGGGSSRGGGAGRH